MSTPTFTSGQVIRFTATFTTQDTSAPIDPTRVVFIYAAPSTPVQFEYPTGIIRDGVGQYHYDLDTTGLVPSTTVWLTYEWASHGGGQALDSATARLVPAALVPAF